MRRQAWAGALVGLLAVAACSSKGSTTTATTPAAATTPTVAGVTTTTIPKFSGSANSHYCNVARQFSQIAVAKVTTDPKSVFQEFDSLAPQYLAATPSVIKADVTTIIDAINQLETAVKAVNYDLTKIKPADLSAVQDPKFTAAVARIDAYDGQVCGLSAATTTTAGAITTTTK